MANTSGTGERPVVENSYVRVTTERLPAGDDLVGEVDVEPGTCVFIGPEHLPDTHSVRNVGAGPVTFLRIDLLSTGISVGHPDDFHPDAEGGMLSA